MLNWKWLTGGGFIAGFIAASTAFYQFHEWRIDKLITSKDQEKAAAVAVVTGMCAQLQTETYEMGESHDREIAAINQHHASIVKRLRSEGVRTIAVAVPSLADHAAPATGLPAVVGIEAVEITERFALCDEQAQRLIDAQTFIKRRTQN